MLKSLDGRRSEKSFVGFFVDAGWNMLDYYKAAVNFECLRDETLDETFIVLSANQVHGHSDCLVTGCIVEHTI